jgi:hypothetical protein
MFLRRVTVQETYLKIILFALFYVSILALHRERVHPVGAGFDVKRE